MACLSNPPRDWRVVAEEVTREHDGQKMTELIEELLQALDQAKPPNGPSGPNSEKTSSPHDLGKTA